MAIDKRQITNIDVNIEFPEIIADEIIYGSKSDLTVYKKDDEYHILLTLPNSLSPTAPEVPPVVEPTTVSNDVAPPLSEPIKELHEYTVQEIVDQVRAGRAKDYWPVGSRIPIFLNTYTLGASALRDARKYGNNYKVAVVIGHDHNLDKETPQVKHSMTLALMHRYNNSTWWEKNKEAIVTVSPSEYTSSVMKEMKKSILAALPNDWESCLLNTTKAGSVQVTETNPTGAATEKIFMLSYYEVHGNASGTMYMESSTYKDGAQLQYEYFKRNGFPKHVGLEIHEHKYANFDMIVASRSRYKNVNNTSILLTDMLDTASPVAMDINGRSPYTTNYQMINYKSTQLLNTCYITAAVKYGSLPSDANGHYDHYSVDKIIAATNRRNYACAINVKVPLSGLILGVNADNSSYVSQYKSGNTTIYHPLAVKYLFSSTNGIPCFTIG